MSSHYTILVGSVLGAAEYVADALAEVIKSAGHEAEIQLTPQYGEISSGSTWIVCTSTHGAGDFPDNIQPFTKEVAAVDLSGVNAYIIGLGDSSYDTFCFAAKNMSTLITEKGATLLAEPFFIDVLNHPIPEDAAIEWFEAQLNKA
ncbi:FMN-binding protein MioC [Alteromonas pelagimontana]|uniref:FMN-binding protein MioC n=1 Tax=Alteromonas pelagimontana TaxID=1858656 RepID=A0A6M4MCW9_9ALTE|nr:FMN-binding protein MioC [Alteromonas pelagimontana]QJR80973.1 FMN-binding protein MioC [Alteromonas pelagimontana]